VEETEWSDPKIISGKIGNPRVDEKDMGRSMFHVKHPSGSVI